MIAVDIPLGGAELVVIGGVVAVLVVAGYFIFRR